jgi:hypothetical protein
MRAKVSAEPGFDLPQRRYRVDDAALPAEDFMERHGWRPARVSCAVLAANGGAVLVTQFDDPPSAGRDQQVR